LQRNVTISEFEQKIKKKIPLPINQMEAKVNLKWKEGKQAQENKGIERTRDCTTAQQLKVVLHEFSSNAHSRVVLLVGGEKRKTVESEQ